jgi:hypothetical protein
MLTGTSGGAPTWLALTLKESQHDEPREPPDQQKYKDQQARVNDLQHGFMLTAVHRRRRLPWRFLP